MSKNAVDEIQSAIARLYEITEQEQQARATLRQLADERRSLRERIIAVVDGIVIDPLNDMGHAPEESAEPTPKASETSEAPVQNHGTQDDLERAVEQVENPPASDPAPAAASNAWEYPSMPSGSDRRYKKQFQEGAQARAEGYPMNECCSYKSGSKSHEAAVRGWRAMDAQLAAAVADGPVEESADEDPVDAHQEPTPEEGDLAQNQEGDGYDMVDVADPDPEQVPWPGEQSAAELNTGSMHDDEWSDVDPLANE